ncbi:MAG: Peptidylprolyl isomerase, partial [Gammaproteobacteria bacterium]|nr:Peptidylprolyl isomerase [Gammaproteobacteria bacterium]
MLLKIREIVSGWVAAVIFVLLIIPFAFWGINYYFGSGGVVLALEVNGTGISLQEFQQAYQLTRQRWQSTTGKSAGPEQESILKQNTVDALIERELIRQINEDLGLKIGDQQLTDTIRKIPEFQGANGFDNVIYEQFVSQMGYSSATFEAQMRADLAAAQLQNAIAQGSFITTTEMDQMVSVLRQERDISYTVLSSDALKEKIEISESDIKSHYEAQSQDYLDPEQVRIAYVDLSRQKMANAVAVDDAGLKTYYENNKKLYEIEDQRKFKQLFIATGTEAKPEQIAVARAEVQALHDLIVAGSSFEDAVAARKNDTAPAVEIVDQDFMTKSIMEPEVDTILFALNEGDVSAPIETASGMHILRLESIKGGAKNTFEDVEAQVEQDYRLSLIESDFVNAVDQLTNLAFEHPDTLQTIADTLHLTIYESPFFDKQWQPEELLRNPKIINASFSNEVMTDGNNSEPLEIEDNRLVVLRVLEHKAANKKPLAEVHDRIITRLRFEHARDEIRKKGELIVKDLKENADPKQVASKYEFEWRQADGVKRDNAEIDNSILQTAFRLGRPQSGQRIYGGNSLNSGDYVVIAVAAVRDAAQDAMSTEEKSSLKSQLQQVDANDALA